MGKKIKRQLKTPRADALDLQDRVRASSGLAWRFRSNSDQLGHLISKSKVGLK